MNSFWDKILDQGIKMIFNICKKRVDDEENKELQCCYQHLWPLEVDEVVQDGDITVKCSRIIKRKTRVTMYSLIVMQHLLDGKGNKLGLYRSADV